MEVRGDGKEPVWCLAFGVWGLHVAPPDVTPDVIPDVKAIGASGKEEEEARVEMVSRFERAPAVETAPSAGRKTLLSRRAELPAELPGRQLEPLTPPPLEPLTPGRQEARSASSRDSPNGHTCAMFF